MIFTTKKMRGRQQRDYYPTEGWVPVAALAHLTTIPARVLDPGAGDGIWGIVAKSCWPSAEVSGVEVRCLPQPDAYSYWFTGDYRELELAGPYNFICGNPPYGDYDPETGRKLGDLVEPFIRRSLSLLAPGGTLCFMLRLAFLEGKGRCRGLWRQYPPRRVLVLADRPSFTGDGKTDTTAYALYYWQQGWIGIPELGWVSKDPANETAVTKLEQGCKLHPEKG